MTHLYLGYEALILKYQLRVPSLRCIYAASERAIGSRTVNADGDERIELPLQRISDTETLAGKLNRLMQNPVNDSASC